MEGQGVALTECDSEVVVPRFVVKEVLLNHVALIAGRDDEIGNAEVGQVLHDVPEDGPAADFDHGLGAELGFFPNSGTKTARKEYRLHRVRAPSPSLRSTCLD